ncbi:MAG: DUF2283 domain-containing protein [bacterium]|nr:DUF2283 domain-containing protein [bacterium]MDD5222384.1 DUF2283 domain-containing protein [bacterium]
MKDPLVVLKKSIVVTWDKSAMAAYIKFVDIKPGGIEYEYPMILDDIQGKMINLGFDKEQRLVGIELLDAINDLPQEILDQLSPFCIPQEIKIKIVWNKSEDIAQIYFVDHSRDKIKHIYFCDDTRDHYSVVEIGFKGNLNFDETYHLIGMDVFCAGKYFPLEVMFV